MAARSRASRSHAWSLLEREQVLVHFVLAMCVVTLLSLGSAEEVDHRSSTLEGRSEMQQFLKWRSRRALLQRAMQERQAPRSFPPPQGNALVNNPRNAPPGGVFFDDQNGRPAARIPDNARRLVPPPHP